MNIYSITDADGVWVNTIVSTLEFAQEEYPNCTYAVQESPAIPAEETERQWRDEELTSTDTAAQTPDWPNRDNILLYRTALRNWPASDDFPATRPTLGS